MRNAVCLRQTESNRERERLVLVTALNCAAAGPTWKRAFHLPTHRNTRPIIAFLVRPKQRSTDDDRNCSTSRPRKAESSVSSKRGIASRYRGFSRKDVEILSDHPSPSPAASPDRQSNRRAEQGRTSRARFVRTIVARLDLARDGIKRAQRNT